MKIIPKLQIMAVILATLPCLLFAQENETQMFLVHEDYVITSERENYMKAAEKLKQAMGDQDITDQVYYTYSTDDNRFLYVSPIENYAALDNHPFQSLTGKPGEDSMEALSKNYDGTYTSRRNYIIHYHPELSYNADKLQSEDYKYYRWLIKHVHADKYDEFIEHLKEWKALYDKTDPAPAYGFTVYTGGLGTDEPVGYVMFWGENAVDFYNMYEKTAKQQGEERKALGKKMQSLLVKAEKVEGQFHPELSYIPETSQENTQSSNK